MKTGLPSWKMFTVLLIVLLSFASCQRRPLVSLRTLLIEMTDREALTSYPDQSYQVKQFSSYDRRSIHPDSAGWFANDDYTHFIREETNEGRREFVMFEDNGPGAIVRWWMTFAGEGAHTGIIRVYLDGESSPVIESEPISLLSGALLTQEPLSTSVSPLTDTLRRGHNLYLPIPYRKSCRITYECDAIEISETRRKPSIYYNINYRKYEKGTRIVSYSADELEHARQLLTDTNAKLSAFPVEAPHDNVGRLAATLRPGDTLPLDYYGRDEAITQLTVKIRSRDREQAMRSLVISITFDDMNTVWVPVGEFFGSGYKRSNLKTFFLAADTNCMFDSYWVMPFRESCSIALIHYGRGRIDAEVTAYYKKMKHTSSTMYFGASWHEYHNIIAAGADVTGGTGKHTDLNFIDITGRGLYVGDAVTVFNTVDAWWGEGDEKIFVDNEVFPSSIGTGTEDYYGYAWCRPEVFNHPFIAQPSGDGNFHPGQTTNIRLRGLDAIPFRESISSNIELWHWLPSVINYSLTTWYYFLPPLQTNTLQQPAAVGNRIPRTKEDLLPLPPKQ
jgi:hypothetical protein